MEICRLSDDQWDSDFDIFTSDEKVFVGIANYGQIVCNNVKVARLVLDCVSKAAGLHVPECAWANLDVWERSP
jgi:hypothetical protein